MKYFKIIIRRCKIFLISTFKFLILRIFLFFKKIKFFISYESNFDSFSLI